MGIAYDSFVTHFQPKALYLGRVRSLSINGFIRFLSQAGAFDYGQDEKTPIFFIKRVRFRWQMAVLHIIHVIYIIVYNSKMVICKIVHSPDHTNISSWSIVSLKLLNICLLLFWWL